MRDRGGTLAYCPAPKFDEALVKFKQELEASPKEPWEKATQITRVKVKETLAFYNEDTKDQVDAHKGGPWEIERIRDSVVDMLKEHFGENIPNIFFEKSIKLLFKYDGRLFVPFTRSLSPAEKKEQWEFYNETIHTVGEKCIMKEVENYISNL